MLIKEIHSQDSYFKLSAINSGETSLNLSTELANYISPGLTPGSSATVRFLLHKSDFLEAVSYISKKLPLYTSTSRSATQVDLSLDFFDTYIKEISSLFGINDVAHYDVSLLYRNDGRIYLNNLNFNGFNLRHFLVEENSTLQFDRVGSDIVIRLRSGQLNCIIREKHANNFGVAVCHYLWGVDRFTNFQPYFKISDPTTNYTVVSYNGKTLFRFLNPNLADSTNTKRWDNNPIDVGGVDYILCREWTEAVNNSNVPSIAELDYLIKHLYNGKYSIVKENGYFILKETCHQSLTVLDTKQLHGPLQKIVYGAPGTGKSHSTDGEIKKIYPTKKDERGFVFRTTFHPDSDYSTFVGCYKPTKGKAMPIYGFDSVGKTVKVEDPAGTIVTKQEITYNFVAQAFTQAYIAAWKNYKRKPVGSSKSVVALPTIPASSATSPYTSASAGAPASTFDRKAVNGFDLTTGEEDLLKVVDVFLFPFVGVDCFGDIHKELDVFVDDKTTPDKHKVVYHRDEVEAEFNRLKARLGEHPNDNLPEGQRFYFLKRLLSDMNKTETLEIEYEFNIWGLYNSKWNTVTIFKGQIYKDCDVNDSKRFALVATYIHEMFHAYFDKKINLPEIEEAIVECATLCFLEMMANVIGSPFNDIFTDYKQRVSDKKDSKGFSYYGFGAYLFEHRSLNWIKLFKDAVIDENSKAVKDYQAMFADTYTTDENKAMRLLYSILNPASAVSTTDGVDYGSKPVFLVIEEINRGNCAQIFGDLFQLLDRNKAGFSTYPIKPDTDLGNYIKEEFEKEGLTSAEYPTVFSGEELIMPNNLYIWATMNTSDQSLFPIDSAFKRRWDWEYVPINTEAKIGWKIVVDGKNYSWSSFLDKINDEIDSTTSSEDKQLGFFFCKADDTDEDDNNGTISAEKFVGKVLFYIYNDVFKDYGLDREFFKDKENAGKKISFRSLFKMNGDINESQVAKLLENLGVKILDANALETDVN